MPWLVTLLPPVKDVLPLEMLEAEDEAVYPPEVDNADYMVSVYPTICCCLISTE